VTSGSVYLPELALPEKTLRLKLFDERPAEAVVSSLIRFAGEIFE